MVSKEEFARFLERNTGDVRTAVVRGSAREVAAYLPSCYQVTDDRGAWVTIQGVDIAGWTLDKYIIPRLASGLIFAEEVK